MNRQGKFVQEKKSNALYFVYRDEGNNPSVPTNTPQIYMVNVSRGGYIFTTPQRYVTIPVSVFDEFFTDRLTVTPPAPPFVV